MRNIINSMRGVGADDKTVNLFIALFILFTFILGVGAAGVLFWQVLNNIPPTPIIVGIVTAILGVLSAVGIAAHQTQAIDGSAAAAASQTASALQPSITAAADATKSNNETLQQALAILAAIQTAQQTQGVLAGAARENTAAVRENTATTQENTQVEKGLQPGK